MTLGKPQRVGLLTGSFTGLCLMLSGSLAVCAEEEPHRDAIEVAQGQSRLSRDELAQHGHDHRVRACWNDLVEIWLEDPWLDGLADRTIDRFFQTDAGRSLVRDLCAILGERRDEADRQQGSSGRGSGVPGVEPSATPRIELHFVRALPSCSEDSDGCFWSIDADAGAYGVAVRSYVEQTDLFASTIVFGEYPGNPSCDVVFLFREPESWMAQTLYHELLHIWFINSFDPRSRLYPTGHGIATRCEFEIDFLEMLDAHAQDLAIAEGQLVRRYLESHAQWLPRAQSRPTAQTEKAVTEGASQP